MDQQMYKRINGQINIEWLKGCINSTHQKVANTSIPDH